MARAWTDEIFTAFLKQGKWSEQAEDNAVDENLTADLVRRIVTNYRAHPNDRDAIEDLGLLALAMGVAEWGIADPASLPPDPRDNNWASDTAPDSGKHLMSYAVGGVGISHADVGDLEKFIRRVANDAALVPPEHRPALLRLANKGLYKSHKVQYDEIRAAGTCVKNPIDADLNGVKFKHHDANTNCAKYANKKLSEKDWQVFRTWMRVALRTKANQEWLARLWMDKYWRPTLKKVPPGPGYIEEAIVNVRLRNSGSAYANRALKRKAKTIAQRVQRELDQYGVDKPSARRRRCRLMQRPVVLYRYFSGEPAITGIKCPANAD